MKKLLLLVLLIVCVGCYNKGVINNVNSFEKMILKLEKDSYVAYDIRSIEKCEESRIKSFLCMGTDIENLAVSINLIYKKTRMTLILIDDDGVNAKELVNLLNKEFKFKRVYYFDKGFDEYIKLKSDKIELVFGPCEC